MTLVPSRRLLLAAVGVLLVATIVAIHAPVRNAPFLARDDTTYVTENPYVRDGLTADGVRHAFFASHAALWMPLTFVSHMIDVEMFGLTPTGPRMVNVALHAANVLLALWLLVRATGAVGPSIVAASIFALHPLRVESVVWIAERKDVLSVCFGLVALHAWVTYVHRPVFGRYLVVVACTLLAMLAKPMVVTLPVFMLLLDLWPLRRLRGTVDGASAVRARDLVVEKIPLLLLSAIAAAMTLHGAGAAGSLASMDEHSLASRLAHAAVSYVWYVAKTIWPTDLAIYYPYPAWTAWQVAAAVGLLLGATMLAVRTYRRAPWIAVGLAWFVVGLLPVIGIFQAGTQGMADRFTYLPSLGLIVAVVWTFDVAARSPRARGALDGAAVVVVTALGIASARQAGHWRDARTLYRHAVEVTGDWSMEAEYANALLQEGSPEEAYRQFQKVRTIAPAAPKVAFGLGLAAKATGRLDEAEAQYRATVRLDYGYAKAHVNLGRLLLARKPDEAFFHLSEAMRLDPTSSLAVGNLRDALAARGIDDPDAYITKFVTWSDAVAADSGRPGGSAYAAGLTGQLLGPRADAVGRCMAMVAEDQRAPFSVYVAVNADGSLAEVAALPPTHLGNCIGTELRTARASAPPFTPFHGRVAVFLDG